MAEEYIVMKKSEMTTFADSIRSATGKTGEMSLLEMNEALLQGTGGVSALCGTVVSDGKGVITFPQLSFTPKVIVVWNISQTVVGGETPSEQDTDDEMFYNLDEYNGFILTAIYQDGVWFSLCPARNSAELFLSNATANVGSVITDCGNGVYQYDLSKRIYLDAYTDGAYDITNAEFNYAIYG